MTAKQSSRALRLHIARLQRLLEEAHDKIKTVDEPSWSVLAGKIAYECGIREENRDG